MECCRKLSVYGFRYVNVLLYEFCRKRKEIRLKSYWSCLKGEIIATTKNSVKYLKPRNREKYCSIFQGNRYSVMNFMIFIHLLRQEDSIKNTQVCKRTGLSINIAQSIEEQFSDSKRVQVINS